MKNNAFKTWVQRWNIGPGMNDLHFSQTKGQTPPPNYSGFDGTVGPGWVPILDWLAEELIALGWNRGLDQVKEKFGTLRFYARGLPADPVARDACYARIMKAEQESAQTCEECGKPGMLRSERYWLLTLCAACDAQRNGS